MREDTEQEKQLKAEIARLARQVEYDRRVLQVLVAVGHLSESLIEKAREIVSSFS